LATTLCHVSPESHRTGRITLRRTLALVTRGVPASADRSPNKKPTTRRHLSRDLSETFLIHPLAEPNLKNIKMVYVLRLLVIANVLKTRSILLAKSAKRVTAESLRRRELHSWSDTGAASRARRLQQQASCCHMMSSLCTHCCSQFLLAWQAQFSAVL